MTHAERERIADRSVEGAHDPRLHRLLRIWILATVTGLLILTVVVVMEWIRSKDNEAAILGLAEQQREAVSAGEQLADQLRDLGEVPRVELPDPVDAVDPDDPELQDPENQDSELQDPEIQEAESQDLENQDPENQDPDPDDPDRDDPENQDPEVNDPDPDDPENQDEEIQEPEIQEPEEQNAPSCPAGYSQREFVYFGPDNLPDTGDEQTWMLCVKDEPT